MPIAGNPIQCATREVLLVLLTLTGGGNDAAPTVDASANVFESATRTAEGEYTLTLKEKFRKARIVGAVYGKTNYGSGAARKVLIIKSKDVREAGTIVFGIEDGTDGQSNAATELGTTEFFDINLALYRGLTDLEVGT